MTTATTWGQAYDYVWRNKWKHLPSATTNRINAGHITDYAGRSFPLSRMGKVAWWIELISNLREDHPNWQNGTINRVLSAGTTVLKYTYKAELHSVKCPTFDRLKEGEHRLVYFTKEQVDKMVFVATDVFERPDLSDAILFSAYTGIRQDELMKLRVEDVDFSLDTIWIGGKPGRETKGREVRAIAIHPRLTDILSRRLANRDPKARVFGDDWANKDALYRAFKKVRDFCGIDEDHVWHCLRHSFGTFLGEVTHPVQIKALMGHKNIETSLRYVKATDSALRTAINAI